MPGVGVSLLVPVLTPPRFDRFNHYDLYFAAVILHGGQLLADNSGRLSIDWHAAGWLASCCPAAWLAARGFRLPGSGSQASRNSG